MQQGIPAGLGGTASSYVDGNYVSFEFYPTAGIKTEPSNTSNQPRNTDR